jgi:hypothetical protein
MILSFKNQATEDSYNGLKTKAAIEFKKTVLPAKSINFGMSLQLRLDLFHAQ